MDTRVGSLSIVGYVNFKTVSSAALGRVSLEDALGGLLIGEIGAAPFWAL